MTDLLAELRAQRLLAIVRGTTRAPDSVVRAVAAMADEGIRLVEVSLTTPGALEAISLLRKEMGAAVHVGAGTVLDAEAARMARDAGAEFLLSPGLPEDLRAVLAVGVDVVPGALTPTEVAVAVRAGACAVKIFPASAFDPSYLQALHGPFPEAPLVAVGGVDLRSVPQLLDAGAVAVGVGSPLLEDAADGGDLGTLRDRARAYRSAVDDG